MSKAIKKNDRVKVTKGVFKGETGDVEEVSHFRNTTMVTVYLDEKNSMRCRIYEARSALKVVSK
jgi:transcription antitermination factor NusG